ncbi:MAG: YitT family protein [Candidatus Pelethousia sp.]|nr:YitT family protein [Candidatus Pelethousia sp.]
MEKKRQTFKFDPKEDTITLLIIALVCMIHASALTGFYVPHGFLSGGVTGVAMLANYMTGVPMWMVIIGMNIPICLVGIRFLRPKSILFSIVASLMFSIAMTITEGWDFGVQNPLVSAAAGASIIGFTGAWVIKRDATMGGTDIISAILSRRYSIPMGTVSICFNLVIMSLLGFLRGLELALVSMIAMFVCNVAFNAALRGLNRVNTLFIISDKWDEIAPLVLNELHRGVTYIHAEGAYTGVPRKLVYCIVRSVELAKVKSIVKEQDPHALFSIIETQEVVGRGFGSFN